VASGRVLKTPGVPAMPIVPTPRFLRTVRRTSVRPAISRPGGPVTIRDKGGQFILAGSASAGEHRNGFRFLWFTLCLLLLMGCAHGSAVGERSQETVAADYGPNPLADCLRWPKGAPHVEPLYAP
jgi:hypothetical protein